MPIDYQRKFIIGGLEVRRLTTTDIILLSAFAVAVLLQYYFLKVWTSKIVYGLVGISFLIGILTVSSPIGLRFRNVYFSLIWLACCLCFLANPYSLAKLPLLTFLLYQALRLVFWKLYDREFIPFQAGKGALYRYFSKIEGRTGGTKDRRFMKILMILGFFIFMYCLLGMVGVPVPIDK